MDEPGLLFCSRPKDSWGFPRFQPDCDEDDDDYRAQVPFSCQWWCERYPEEGVGPCAVVVEVFHHQLVVVQRPELSTHLMVKMVRFLLAMVMVRINIFLIVSHLLLNILSTQYIFASTFMWPCSPCPLFLPHGDKINWYVWPNPCQEKEDLPHGGMSECPQSSLSRQQRWQPRQRGPGQAFRPLKRNIFNALADIEQLSILNKLWCLRAPLMCSVMSLTVTWSAIKCFLMM